MFTQKDLLMNTCCNNIFYEEDMNRWESCPSTMLANADNYYTKSEVDEIIEDISISGGGITSGEVQSMIDAATEPIEGSVEALSGAVEQLSTDMENKADKSDIPSLDNYYDKTEVNTIIEDNEYAISQAINDLNDRKLDASAYTPSDLSQYWTSAQTKNYVDNAISGIPSNILAVVWEDLTLNMNDELWDSLVDAFNNDIPIYCIYHYSGDNQTYVSQIPMAGDVFISENDSTMNLWRSESDTDTYYVEIKRNGSEDYTVTDRNIQWQQYLSAGVGISIHNNVISATGGGTGITVDQNLDSGSTNPVTNSAITNALDTKADASNVYNKTEVLNLINNKANVWCGSQSEFDALITKDANTIYLVY